MEVREEQQETARCVLCGGEASSFGSVAVAAGRICASCAGKLSPWFHCRADLTTEELRDHLSIREENRARLSDFHPTLRLWKDPTLYLDEAGRRFAVTDAMVKDFPAENPDILDWSQILQCDVEIEEHRTERKRLTPGAGRVSYRPKRHDYRFHVHVRILVEHPSFHEIRFRLNRKTLVVKAENIDLSPAGKVVKDREYLACVRMAKEMQKLLLQARDAGLAEKADTAEEGAPLTEEADTVGEGAPLAVEAGAAGEGVSLAGGPGAAGNGVRLPERSRADR